MRCTVCVISSQIEEFIKWSTVAKLARKTEDLSSTKFPPRPNPVLPFNSTANEVSQKQNQLQDNMTLVEPLQAEEASPDRRSIGSSPLPAPIDESKRRQQMKGAFTAFDTDGGGSLNAVELSAILSMGSTLSEADALEKAKAVIAKYDFDGNGELDVRLTRRSNSHAACNLR